MYTANKYKPVISVLMTIYQDVDYLSEAVKSILDQSYRNFEFLIIAEPETSAESLTIIRSFQDKRIRLIINKKHLGFSRSLNKGIKLSKGKYIARMDADDISLHHRLLLQFLYMELHANVILCGTNAISINGKGEIINRTDLPRDSRTIKICLYFRNVIYHPTVLFRREQFIAEHFFYKVQQAEDYELWTRICLTHNIVNLKGALLKRRLHKDNSTYKGRDKILESDVCTQKELWKRTGIQIDIEKPFYDMKKLTSKERKQRAEYLNELKNKTLYFAGKSRLFKEIRDDIIDHSTRI